MQVYIVTDFKWRTYDQPEHSIINSVFLNKEDAEARLREMRKELLNYHLYLVNEEVAGNLITITDNADCFSVKYPISDEDEFCYCEMYITEHTC